MIPIDELLDVFNRNNAHKADWAELVENVSKFIANQVGYCFWQDYIVDDAFAVNNFADVDDLVWLIEDRPRYVPKTKEFLRYADWEYYERSSHTMKLFQFLQKELHISTDNVSFASEGSKASPY